MFSDNNKTLVLIVSLATLILMGFFILVVALMHSGKMDEDELAQIKQDADDAFAAADASADPTHAAQYYGKARALYGTLLRAVPKEDVRRRLDILVRMGETLARDRNQYTRALATWQQAVTIDPKYPPPGKRFSNCTWQGPDPAGRAPDCWTSSSPRRRSSSRSTRTTWRDIWVSHLPSAARRTPTERYRSSPSRWRGARKPKIPNGLSTRKPSAGS